MHLGMSSRMLGIAQFGLLLAVCELMMGAPVMAASPPIRNVVLGVHGGTGGAQAEVTPELDRAYRADLEAALKAGYAALQRSGATSLDGVEAAIRVLEDSPHFNAGRGSVLTAQRTFELDASVMEGAGKKAGAVAGTTTLKNPISAARGVMEKTRHVLLIGPAADRFGADSGLEVVEPRYFHTPRRERELDEYLKSRTALPADAEGSARIGHGTVGAVALDSAGHLAAGTSTGGMTGKRTGRVGDSPIIGAGTYADDASCAVSATGHGEFFIRYAVAHEIASLMKYKGLGVQEAADDVIQEQLKPAGGEGGVIVLDRRGNFAMSYNSEGLYRGYITKDGEIEIRLYDK